jgi:hypothetical protein
MDISDLVGISYKIHGRDESGLDCFGLIWLIAKRNGTPVRDPVYKGFDRDLMRLYEYVGVLKAEVFEIGCILEIEKDNRLHLGYSIDRDRMIHCTHNEGVIVEDINKYQVKGYYKFKELKTL